MVKGISKQVIVVRPPDSDLFDQAIFILRDKNRRELSEEELVKQANKAVEHYVHNSVKGGWKGRKKAWTPVFWGMLGALCTGLIWLVTVLP